MRFKTLLDRLVQFYRPHDRKQEPSATERKLDAALKLAARAPYLL